MFFLSFNVFEKIAEKKKKSGDKIFKLKNSRPILKITKKTFFIDNNCETHVFINLTEGLKEEQFLLHKSLGNINPTLKVGSIISINSLRYSKSLDKNLRLFEILELSVLGFEETDKEIEQSLYDFENLKEFPTHTIAQIEPSLTNKCWSLEVEVINKNIPFNMYGPKTMYLGLKDSTGQIIAKVVGDENVARFNQIKLNHKYIIRNAECPGRDKYLEDIDILCTKQTHFVPSKVAFKKEDKLLYKYKNNPKLLKFVSYDNGYKNNKSFCMLNEIVTKELNTNVYIEAIIEQVGETIITRSKLTMRNVSIVDMSGLVVNVVLWGEQAEKFSYRPGTMLLFINVVVNKFNNKFQLMVTRKSGMVEMEDFDGFQSCDRLREWWVNKWWPYRKYRESSI